jgi:WD40 repeat-containing protein SMU1
MAGARLGTDLPLLGLLAVPQLADTFLVLSRSPSVTVLSSSGHVLLSMGSGKAPGSGADFLAFALSPQGRWLYCAAEDGVLYVFDVKAGQLETIVALEEATRLVKGAGREVQQLLHHPQRNLLAAVRRDGELSVLTS